MCVGIHYIYFKELYKYTNVFEYCIDEFIFLYEIQQLDNLSC